MTNFLDDPRSFVALDLDGMFPLYNLPYCVFKKHERDQGRVGVAIGAQILDLTELEREGLLKAAERPLFQDACLNPLGNLGSLERQALRASLMNLLHISDRRIQHRSKIRDRVLLPQEAVDLQLPFLTRGFTDFYSSRFHAENVSALFRGEARTLPNWSSMPIAYNGRASTLRVSGHEVIRPWGVYLDEGEGVVTFAPTRKMDFELEMGAFVGKPTAQGERLDSRQAEEHLWGLVLLNDWSARDIQAWESRPLGPFNGKSFLTSISPWVVSLEALEPFRTSPHVCDPKLPPYLQNQPWNYDIHLEALISRGGGVPVPVTATNLCVSHWTFAQMLAHHSSNGCEIQTGDLIGSGTLSGPAPQSRACLLEITKDGQDPLPFMQGHGYLEDGDEVILRGFCQNNDLKIGFGCLRGKIVAAR